MNFTPDSAQQADDSNPTTTEYPPGRVLSDGRSRSNNGFGRGLPPPLRCLWVGRVHEMGMEETRRQVQVVWSERSRQSTGWRGWTIRSIHQKILVGCHPCWYFHSPFDVSSARLNRGSPQIEGKDIGSTLVLFQSLRTRTAPRNAKAASEKENPGIPFPSSSSIGSGTMAHPLASTSYLDEV